MMSTENTNNVISVTEHEADVIDFHRFREIVVPLDGSDLSAKALRAGRQLATAMNVPLRVVSFPKQRNLDDMTDRLRFQMAPFEPTSVRIEPNDHGRAVGVADLIVEEAHKRNQLVVMATVGHIRAGHVVGSVAEAVIDRLEQPTVLVGPKYEGMEPILDGRVVVALHDTEHVDNAIHIALEWAREFEHELEIVHGSDKTRLAGLIAAGVEDAAAQESEHLRVITEVASRRLGRAVALKSVPDSHFDQKILEETQKLHASFVVISPESTKGLTRLVSGDAVASIVHRAVCPVLVG